jgi:hypothetical protein
LCFIFGRRYEDSTSADHTCQCEAAEEGLPENHVRMTCIAEELYCCEASGVCYETDDATEHIITDRLVDGMADLSIWRSCTHVYQGGVETPFLTHEICHEFAYSYNVTVSRQYRDPPLAGCRVSINGQECNSCIPCEQSGVGMVGYDCTNIQGVDQIPTDILPMGLRTICYSYDFPRCTFNGGFVDVDKYEVASWTSTDALINFVGLLMEGAFFWN